MPHTTLESKTAIKYSDENTPLGTLPGNRHKPSTFHIDTKDILDTMNSNIKTRTKKKKAFVLQKSGKYSEAKDILHQVCEIDKRDAEAWLMLGSVYSSLGDLQAATNCFEKSTTIRPDYVEAWYNLGTAQQRLGQFNDSIKTLTRMLSIAKKMSPLLLADAHSNLGTAYVNLNEFNKAVDAYKKASSLAPSNLHILLNLANALKTANQPDKSLEVFNKALSLEPQNADIYQQIGSTYERMHRLDEAEKSALRATELDPHNTRACLLLAQLLRRKGKPEEARDLLEKTLAVSPPSHATAYLYNELGHVYDKLSDFPKAFATWSQSNQILSSLPQARQFNPDAYLEMLYFLRDYYTGARLSYPADIQAKSSIHSPVFLVGHPRSGTTLTEQILSSHTNIIGSDEQPLIDHLIRQIAERVPREEEIPRYIDQLDENGLAAFRDFYWNQAEQVIDPDVRKYTFIDKLPLNIIYLGLIQRIFPTARILVALRDPRDVCLSCFMQAFRPNKAMVHFYDLESTAKHYQVVMEMWLQYRKNLQLDWIEFRYENMVDDMESETKRLIAFLGLEWDDCMLRYFEADKQRYIATPSYRDITKPIFTKAIGRWKNYQTQLEPVLIALEPFVHEFGYNKSDLAQHKE